MVSERAVLYTALVLVLVLVGSVAFVDFHALESQTDVDSSVGTSRVNDATAPTDEPLHLLVLGDGPQSERLEDELVERLSPLWVSVEPVEDDVESVDGPILAVSVSTDGVAYDPVTPAARVVVDFGFVGNGNVSVATAFARGERPTVLGHVTPYVVSGSVTVTDRSRGVASRPGYRSYLGAIVADTLTEKLTTAPGMPNAGQLGSSRQAVF